MTVGVLIRLFLAEVMIVVSFFVAFSLTSCSSVSESRGSTIASSLTVIVNNLIFSSNSALVIVRALVLERYKARDSRSRIIVLFRS